MTGVKTAKLAVMLWAALMVTVVEALEGSATLPDQPLNPYPLLGVAVIDTTVPSLNQAPLEGETVPPAVGEAEIVNLC